MSEKCGFGGGGQGRGSLMGEVAMWKKAGPFMRGKAASMHLYSRNVASPSITAQPLRTQTPFLPSPFH